MNKLPLIASITLTAIILTSTLVNSSIEYQGFQTYLISADDENNAEIIRAILRKAPDVEHFTDLGITIILAGQPLILSNQDIPENMALPTIRVEAIVESAVGSVSLQLSNYYRIKESGFITSFTLMDREMIKAYYLDADGTLKTRYPLFLELSNLKIDGDKAYAELGCMGYGGSTYGFSRWGGCEFYLDRRSGVWSVTSTHVRGI